MPYWDRFDICEAYFCLAAHIVRCDSDYDAIMAKLERVGFKPRPLLIEAPKHLSSNGKHIYKGLVWDYFNIWLA